MIFTKKLRKFIKKVSFLGVMDKVDYKILNVLDNNARISVTALAHTLRLSKDVVQYRIKKLEEEKIILGSRAVIAVARLGYMYHKILVKFVPLTTEQEEEWRKWGRKRADIVWMGICEGEWNGNMTIRTCSFQEQVDFMDAFLGKFGNFVQKKEMLPIKTSYRFNRKFLSEGKYISEFYHDFMLVGVVVDEIDKVVIGALTRDARCKLVDIAKKTKLSAEAVAVRLRKLEQQKVILGYKQKIDYTRFGLQNYEVFLAVKDPQLKIKIIEFCRYHTACDTVMEYLGYYDLQLTFLLKNQAEFRAMLAQMRDSFGDQIIEYQPLAAYQEFFVSPVEGKK